MAIAELESADRPSTLRLWIVPILSTLAGSTVTLLPFVVTAPTLPPFGLLMALAWRLLRPEMWPAWMALPLGLADDLIGGAPLGSAMTGWTIAFLSLDIADHRPMWRDYLLDWGLACLCIAGCGLASWAFARFVSGGGPFWPAIPPVIWGMLIFPVIARLCARLDHWRLRR